MKNLFIALLFITKILAIFCQEQPACEYASFLDALPGGVFGDTSLFKLALKLSGYQVSSVRCTGCFNHRPSSINKTHACSSSIRI
jgi:hypothetical protein